MDLDNMDTMQLCEDLASAFDKIVQDNKQNIPRFDELISKGGKFQKDLKAALASLCSFLDVFQHFADGASTTNSSNRDSGIMMTRIVLRQRAFESQLKLLSTTLEQSLLVPLQTKPEEWKKNVNNLDRQHAKDLKHMRTGIKQNTDQLTKLRKKAKKDPSQMLYKQQEKIREELHSKYVALEDQERKAVRKINEEERLHYSSLLQYLKPVIEEQCKMIESLHKLAEIGEDLERCIEENSNGNAVEEIILRNLKPSMEVIIPTASLSITRNSRGSLDRSLSSRTSSVESLTEADSFHRSSSRNKSGKPQIPTFRRHSLVYSTSKSPHVTSEILKIRRNSISSIETLEDPDLESNFRERSTSPPSQNEIAISDEDLTEMYSSMTTITRTHKRALGLQRQNSQINRYGSSQAPLTNIEEHNEYMPQPMIPLENSPLALHAGTKRNDSITQGAPVSQYLTSDLIMNPTSITTQLLPNINKGRKDSFSPHIPLNSLKESRRSKDFPSQEQMGKDDDSSEGSQKSSSGYGSPGDEHFANNLSNTPKPFERNIQRRASFSTFSPTSPPVIRNKKQPSLDDAKFSRDSWRRQSCYATPPSIPENPNQVPSLCKREIQAVAIDQPSRPLIYAHQQQPKPLHLKSSQKQSGYFSEVLQNQPGPFLGVPQNQSGPFSGAQQNQSSSFSRAPQKQPELFYFSSSTSQPMFESETIHSWSTHSEEIDPVTNQVEIYPLNDSSTVQRSLEDKEKQQSLTNSPVESQDSDKEDLPPPPDYGHYQQISQRSKRIGTGNIQALPVGSDSWSQAGQEIQMVYEHLYNDNIDITL